MTNEEPWQRSCAQTEMSGNWSKMHWDQNQEEELTLNEQELEVQEGRFGCCHHKPMLKYQVEYPQWQLKQQKKS